MIIFLHLFETPVVFDRLLEIKKSIIYFITYNRRLNIVYFAEGAHDSRCPPSKFRIESGAVDFFVHSKRRRCSGIFGEGGP